MKTLRLFRNLAVLFILVMALLASRPGVARTRGKSCGVKAGYNFCSFDNNGNCLETRCEHSKGGICLNFGCV